jgi:Rho GDP-dissociation inhibitor
MYLWPHSAAEVEIVKVEVVCPNRPGGNVTLNFKKKEKVFQIKEGCVYHLRIYFVVRFDIVNGLKFVNNVYKMFARVEQEEEKMGSFAPQKTPHVFDLPMVEAPSGILARGEYKGKGLVHFLLCSFLTPTALSIVSLTTSAKLPVIGECT